MQEFIAGQRYLCDAEPELGLGVVTQVEHRTLTINFGASDTQRQYAKANSPLTRIIFDAGDDIRDTQDRNWEVMATELKDGLVIYHVSNKLSGDALLLPETELSPRLSLGQPVKRLLAGQTDAMGWFSLRRQALEVLGRIQSTPSLGLCGGRTELLPHQLYIASQVASRPAPRVLLSDEVGLGKTIEACLILQQQLFTGLAGRVLIMVPDSLLHQWLVELLRRFNLRFSILDEERCKAQTEFSDINPFETEQLVLCSRSFLLVQDKWREQALSAGWDLLIVDEAHHLLQNRAAPSSGDSNALSPLQLVAAFAREIPGLLLLTATPDQAGLSSHFGLLQLLDPGRFHDYQHFVDEQHRYHELASLLDPLLNYAELDELARHKLRDALWHFAADAGLQKLISILAEATEADIPAQSQQLMNALLDRHGTGRIVFRNTRRQVSGFPQRELYKYPMALPQCYQNLNAALYPEINAGPASGWLQEDPRIQWLCLILRQHSRQKFLLICHHRATAEALETWLRLHKGIRSAVFHENMTLIERDRAAAYFAEPEGGAQLLVCSEIGSEGRNFQFSSHLVLFDLPEHPDLLEQRIGRLDRIGQRHNINIHLPYFTGSAQSVLASLYEVALNIFDTPNPVAATVWEHIEPELSSVLSQSDSEDVITALVNKAQELNLKALADHAQGRDRLLELNSCRTTEALALVKRVAALEQELSPADFLKATFAAYGLEYDADPDHICFVKPNEDMLLSSFPQVPDDGLRFTLNRAVALTRDDLPFVSWLHPLVQQSLDLILQDHQGKANIAILRDKRLPTGTLILESLYRVTVSAPPRLQATRWFPVSLLRALVDSQKRSIGKSLSSELVDNNSEPLDKTHISTLVTERKAVINLLAKLGEQVVQKQLPALIKTNTEQMHSALDTEINRLESLLKVNPQVQQSEIEYLQHQRAALTACYAQASLHLDAVRLLLVL